jgi:tRNA C32,U32 (ribose-2'-O)-methylase TrmJ
LPGFLQALGQSRIALVFGPEKSGLTEEEMSHASVFLRLPTESEFPTLNVSHAVAVTLAAARLAGDDGSTGGGEPWAAAKDIEGAIEHWDRALQAIGFYDTGHHDRTLRDWRRIVAGRPLAERDVKILRGIANRILVSLRRKEKLDEEN